MAEIRQARAEDVEAITSLLEELDRFYGGEPAGAPQERVDGVLQALFGDTPAPQVLLAWDGGVLAGLASYSLLWPAAGVTSSLYLKELYVAATHRRTGVGRELMDALTETAREHGCSRVEWTTEVGNTAARAFYASLGAEANPEKIFYRVAL